jgi:copper resistance protein C
MPESATRKHAALLAGLACAWLLLACAPALAHATLVEASPPQGGEVSNPPERIELRFSEPVDAEFDPVVVRAADGARVDAHDARVDPEDARVVLADLERVPEGSYTVKWRVTSIDGHVVEGRSPSPWWQLESPGHPKMLGTETPPSKPQGRTADTMGGTMEEVLGE